MPRTGFPNPNHDLPMIRPSDWMGFRLTTLAIFLVFNAAQFAPLKKDAESVDLANSRSTYK